MTSKKASEAYLADVRAQGEAFDRGWDGKLEVRVEPTRYEVTKYPKRDSMNAHSFTLWVERRNVDPDLWCVTDGAYNYRKDGHKSYERQSSSRTDRFKNAYRFPLEQALEIAKKAVDKLTIMNKTAEEVWEWEQSK